MENIEYDIALSSLSYIGPVTFNKLVDYFGTSKNVLNAKKNELLKAGFKDKVIESILNSKKNEKHLENELLKLKKNNIIPISRESILYPKNLKDIKNAPIVLYVKGNLNILNQKSIAIVGSRKCSEYGKEIAYNFSLELARNDINIVSGLAMGIDTCAHVGALNAKGKTVAVLGNGFDYIFPNENRKLFYNIIDNGGAIVTEYLPEVMPFKGNFLARNRIISGMSLGVIVAEANKNSGALVTAKLAREQGKAVFCVPSNITNSYNDGGNNLLKHDSKIVTSSNDILEALKIDSKTKNETNNISSKIELEEKYKPIIVELLQADLTAIELSKKLSKNISEILSELTILELKGLVKKLPGGSFKVARKFNI